MAVGHRVSLSTSASHSHGLRLRVTRLNISLQSATIYRYLQVMALVRDRTYQLYELVQLGAPKT